MINPSLLSNLGKNLGFASPPTVIHLLVGTRQSKIDEHNRSLEIIGNYGYPINGRLDLVKRMLIRDILKEYNLAPMCPFDPVFRW